MRKTGLSIADSCDYSGITINKFNYYRKKYGYDSLKELKYPLDSFKELCDEIRDRVENGMTVTTACKLSNIDPCNYYNYLKFHKLPSIGLKKPYSKEEFDKIYDEIKELSKEGYTIKASCNKLGIDYSTFSTRRHRSNKPIFSK